MAVVACLALGACPVIYLCAADREREAWRLADEMVRYPSYKSQVHPDRARQAAARAMSDPFLQVRLPAALAYLRFGGKPSRALPVVRQALLSPRTQARMIAELRKELRDDGGRLRFTGAEAEYEELFAGVAFAADQPALEAALLLTQLPQVSVGTLRRLAPHVDAADFRLAFVARGAIEQARDLEPVREELLAAFARSKPWSEVWIWCSKQLVRDKPSWPQLIDQLRPLLLSTDPALRSHARFVLQMGSPGLVRLAHVDLIPVLEAEMRRHPGSVPPEACVLGEAGRPLLPLILSALKGEAVYRKNLHPQALYRPYAPLALASIDPGYPGLLERLRDDLANERAKYGSEYGGWRAEVLTALLRLGDRSPELQAEFASNRYSWSMALLAELDEADALGLLSKERLERLIKSGCEADMMMVSGQQHPSPLDPGLQRRLVEAYRARYGQEPTPGNG